MKLWKVPQLVFKKDESIDRSIKIDNLIRDINKK
jgi:ribosome-binding factor A